MCQNMSGLSTAEVEFRRKAGLSNESVDSSTKTVAQIIRSNVVTYYNLIFLIITILLIVVGSFRDLTFLPIIISNMLIGIIQELRSKKILDDLTILNTPKITVRRNGSDQEVLADELVQDDVITLSAGGQIPADALVLSGNITVNEALITGEADEIVKKEGDSIFSGSFVISGECLAKLEKVGKDSYISGLMLQATQTKEGEQSEMIRALNRLVQTVGVIILPIGAILFLQQYFFSGATMKDSVTGMVAAILGMIPEGLVLLTSVALTLGSMVLATKKTLVQELYCIETLARVDTLCLDKTGTITEGTMKVEDVQLYDTAQTTVVQHTAKFDPETGEPVQNVSALKPEVTVSAEKENGQIQETVNLETVSQEERQKLQEIDHIMGNMMSVLHDQNATADALRKRFPSRNDLKLIHAIPFSSDRKYSGAVFEGRGTYLMGAAQFLFPEGNEELLEHCSSYAQEGYRILVLAHSEQETKGTERPTGLEPLGLFLITDVIREEAPDTLAFFDSQGVDLKVISGDDPVTVSAIAKKAGLKNANHYIDATTIKTPEEMQRAVAECSVFGRVTPQQKKQMVQALQSQKHTVAMTGDGVNDVLALKEADCSIAMAAGSDAAKNIANVVLLDSNFGAMPHIVNQGRRVVNNIRSAASMFLIKTIFSVLLSLITIFFGDAYPFEPIQMSLISACAVGIPTFLLTQENNYNKIDHTFLRHVFMNAFPAAVTITGCVFTIMLVCQDVYHSNVMLNTACVLVTGWNYMSALRTVYSPLNTYRKVIIYGMQFAFFISAVVLQDLLTLGSLEFGMIILVFVLMTFSPILIETITEWIRRIYEKSLDREDENKGLQWFDFEEALKASTEPWLVENVYKKLNKKEKEVAQAKQRAINFYNSI